MENFEFFLTKEFLSLQPRRVKWFFIYSFLGATEVIGVFSGFDLNTPVYSAEIQAPALGVDLKCFDEQGE